MEGSLVNVTVGELFLHLTGWGFTRDLRLNMQMGGVQKFQGVL